jgi:cob(I)alamin adenosyltransferase
MRGFIQVYTGNEKTKSTVSAGLSLRAAGAGLRVFIAQFTRVDDNREIAALKRFDDLITIAQFGAKDLGTEQPSPPDIEAAREGLEKVKEVLSSATHDLVIMEEANVAVELGLFSVADLLNIMALKPENVELVITGRNADPRIIERADLVTEMKEIKQSSAKHPAASLR